MSDLKLLSKKIENGLNSYWNLLKGPRENVLQGIKRQSDKQNKYLLQAEDRKKDIINIIYQQNISGIGPKYYTGYRKLYKKWMKEKDPTKKEELQRLLDSIQRKSDKLIDTTRDKWHKSIENHKSKYDNIRDIIKKREENDIQHEKDLSSRVRLGTAGVLGTGATYLLGKHIYDKYKE